MNIKYYFIYLREVIVNSMQTKIVSIVDKNYNIDKNNKIIYLINLIPFFITSFILNLFRYNYLYLRDDIIFYSKESKVSISPCIFDFKIVRNDLCLKDKVSPYFSNVPIKLIMENENIDINDEDEIKIKYLNSGKFVEKILNYKKIKLFSKGNLLN